MSASAFKHIQNVKKRAYLTALVECGGNIRQACLSAGIDNSTPYTKQWREDEGLQEALVEAVAMGANYLEAEAVRRAYDGVDEPTGWYQGKPGGVVRRYSDTLLIFLLKGAMPAKYADRHKLSGDDGPPIKIEDVNDTRERLRSRIAGIATRVGTGQPDTEPNGG